MDDEAAEIELLEQNLNKTKQISQRMISILTNFDSRLNKLEQSIRPLHSSTQLLTRRAGNIESTLQRIDEVASRQDGIAAEEALILRGPQPNQLRAYTDALERLNTSIAFKASDFDSRDTARLVETGAKKLTQLYTKLVAEGSSGVPPGGPDFQPSPIPSTLLNTLRPLVAFLRTLPLPATHPSHAAAPGIFATLKDAQRGYADMRGSWSRKCLETEGRRVVDRAETVDGVSGGLEFGLWVDNLLTVAETEYDLLSELAPLPGSSILPTTFAILITPLGTLFSSTLSSLSALIKRSLHRHTFLALSTFNTLSTLQSRWDDTMLRRAGRRENELKEGLHGLRGVCLRSFPEFLADIKLAAAPKAGGEISVGIADITVSTVKYLNAIPDVQDAVASALLTLGDGNWKMGEGMQVSKGPKLGEGDEQIILEHYLCNVLSTLTTISRSQKRPTFGAVFLLNNVSYLRTHLLLDEPPRASTLLARPAQDALHSAFRTAKAGYFDAAFTPLMQALGDEPNARGGVSKAVLKEKFTRFFDLLEEVVERHRVARVLPDDEEARETVGDEVVRLVVPSLDRFVQKHRDKEFSKNPQKYIKMTPEEVETQIRSLY
ncbi:hypothetical protein BD410DRAFT_771026 [Rickenella mellea]|uniref:Exocyst complex protein EXO70 n=1 Tax=Rickenella mellea TaxID=50990 RepID=A0A4Y7Q458_9AGAM|nr:hypothetical protein BD410DRAFT_771026 [Rickenella mellea]